MQILYKCLQWTGQLILLFSTLNSYAQVDTAFEKTKVTLREYLQLVGKQNLHYLAEQYNVNIAEAGIESAKVFPDPELVMGAYDNQQASLHLGRGYNIGIGTTLELGGQRRARIDLASSQVAFSKASLQEYFRNLQAGAALDYFNALLQYHLFQMQQSAYSTMQQLADADSIRYKLGAITEIDARQSKLEAGNLFNELLQGEANWKVALAQLSLSIGKTQTDTFLSPSGDFSHLQRDFQLSTLISHAQINRADAVTAQAARMMTNKGLQLAKANRGISLGLNAGMQYAGEATNETAPTPAYRSFNTGIALPLKFSNAYKGDIKAAQYATKQAEVQYEQVLLQIQVEVKQAYLNYKAAEKQVVQYRSGLLEEAETVIAGKIYSYKRGETSLLEVLTAQRTYNEVQQHYYQAMFNYAAALVALEHSAGIWDIW